VKSKKFLMGRGRGARLAATLAVATSLVGVGITTAATSPASAAKTKYLTVGGMFPFTGSKSLLST